MGSYMSSGNEGGMSAGKLLHVSDLQPLAAAAADDQAALGCYFHMVVGEVMCIDSEEEMERNISNFLNGGMLPRPPVERPLRDRPDIKSLIVCYQHPHKTNPPPSPLTQLCYGRIQSGYSLAVHQRCWACRKPTKRTCSKCRVAYYCGKECQRASFSHHRAICREPVQKMD